MVAWVTTDVLLGALAIAVGGAIVYLRVAFGPGEEEHKERMAVPHLADEVALEKAFKREIEYIFRNGMRFYTQMWYPLDPSSPKGIVLLLHGVNGHGGRQTPFFHELLTHGWIAASYDLRGHGRSSGRHGYVPSIAGLADDTLAYIRHLKTRFPHLPIFLLGGSMGGLTAVHTVLQVQALSEPLLAGVIFQAPAVHINPAARPPAIIESIARVLHVVAPKLPLLQPEVNPLSADGKPLALPDADPLNYTGRMRLATGLALVNGIEEVAPRLQDIKLPMLIQHGDIDAVIPADACVVVVSLF
ncbi:Aste57867_24481 [Aphanomyces stellatus]|uniref:Aste57867_24481 protein n=1 Tax=Aphanomyces stellatus TaxID=120398 RepID=A0A485LSF3_9STRA|nr:hypothetical protein As57867_024404 [Aphanomyces stellatus]VFU01120.1 Aste57867_24481 [Aphanomyces stellatus]